MRQRTFYKINELSLAQKIELMNKAKNISSLVKIDELDCSKSFSRVRSSLSYEEALKSVSKDAHFSLCFNPDEDWETKKVNYELVVRASNIKHPSSEVFIWIYVEELKFEELIKEFKLLAF